MERIHNLLRKIQDVYYQKGEKQVLDIDLMLDYTRVLYADLLEWRKVAEEQGTPVSVAEPQELEQTAVTTQANVPNEEVIPVSAAAEKEEEKNEEDIVTTTEQEEIPEAPEHPEVPEEEMPAVPEDLTEEAVHEEQEVTVAEELKEVAPHVVDEVATVDTEEPALAIEEPIAEVQTVPEEEVLKPVLEHLDEQIISEIHLELPATAEEPEVGTAPEPEIVAKPEPEPEKEHKANAEYVFQKPFKDIRSFIGINDKYQFMNELFSNNKTAYEATLDKINFCGTGQEAEQWIATEMRERYKWTEEDETYQSLLTTVKKYFA